MAEAAGSISPRLPAPSAMASSPARRPASAGRTVVSDRGNASNARKGRLPRKKKLHPMGAAASPLLLGAGVDGMPAVRKVKPIAKKKDLIEAVRRLSPMYSLSRSSLRSALLGRGQLLLLLLLLLFVRLLLLLSLLLLLLLRRLE